MDDLYSLKERIIKSKLTKKESDIAEYIFHNSSKVCFMSASELAKELKTSNTSVNRMAKALGYNSFSDLQKELQEHISYQADFFDEFRLPPKKRIIEVDNKELSKENLTNKYYELTSNNIMSVLSKNTPDKIDRVVEILSESNHRYINGCRGTADLANRMGFLLRLIVENVILVTDEDINNIEKVRGCAGMNYFEDCMIIFSFNRYKKNTLDIINICKKNLAKIILITDRATAPFSQYADELLIVDVASMSFFNSSISAMFLLELICTKLAIRLGDQAKERLNFLESFINKTQIF